MTTEIIVETNAGAKQLVNIEMFEERHLTPAFVKDAIFPHRPGGYDPLNIQELENIAMQKLLRLKEKGAIGIALYLSGLTTAAIAVLNACIKTGMYVKFMHYSFLQNEWLPQTIAIFDNNPLNAPTEVTEKLWEMEHELRSKFSDAQYYFFSFHVNRLRDAYKMFLREDNNLTITKLLNRTFGTDVTPATKLVLEDFRDAVLKNQADTFHITFQENLLNGDYCYAKSSRLHSSKLSKKCEKQLQRLTKGVKR